MDADQAFEFDLHGVIVVKGVLKPSTVAELRGLMAERLLQDAPDAQARGNQTGRVRGNLLGMGASVLHWGKCFRELLDHPKISPLLEDLVGDPVLAKDGLPSFRIDHIYSQRRTMGQDGTGLHGGRTAHGSQFFDFQNGRFYNGLVVVAFELEETVTNGGGLCCVPASHKKNLDPPFARNLAEGPQSPLIQGVKAEAGDAIIFTEQLLHGTLPWDVPAHDRMTLFYKFSPHGVAHNATFFNPVQFSEMYPDMTKRQLAILEPPAAYRQSDEIDWESRAAELKQHAQRDQLPPETAPRL